MPLCQVKYAEDSDSNYCEDRYMKESAVKVRVEKMLSMLDNAVKESFKGHYAIFKGKRYGCDYDIKYFERKGKGYYVIKENNQDNCSQSELISKGKI